jgi:NADH-quinone oxidoreductase subunit A
MALFAALILGVGIGMIALSHGVGPRRTRGLGGRPLREKFEPYECGVTPLTGTRDRFSVRFYVVAILFILFDIETVFLIPWALATNVQAAWFAEMAAFVLILGFGLVYAWRRGVLEWD